MTVYARSDLVAVLVSKAHGGCSAGGHTRPVENGAPAKVWRLDCPECEDFLRSDTNWSSTLAEIPETYDEKTAREDFEKRGTEDRDQVLALALAKLAGVELPESLVRPMTGNMPAAPAAVSLVNCPDGHPNLSVAKFCGECGQPVASNGAAPAPVPPPEPPPAAPPVAAESPPAPSLPSNTKMRGMKREDLTVLAASAGVATGGSRQDVLDRLIAVNNATKETTGGV